MNFSQLQERLRMELGRRIDRGQLTGTLLARQTGLRQSHLSNFIRRKRQLSLSALDRVLAAQSLSVEDLLPESSRTEAEPPTAEDFSIVPLVSAATALHSPVVNQRSILELIHLPTGMLDQLRPRRTLARRTWQRFVAVRLSAAQARPMDPVLTGGSVAVLDRHFNSLAPNQPPRPNIYAVDVSNTLVFRYVSYDADRLILRPHALDFPVELLRLGPEESPSDCIVGRVCVIITEL
jgi:hypothetical protein